MSDTPETDKLLTDWMQGVTKDLPNFVEIARRLERERDEWRKCAEKLAAIIGVPDKPTWATDDEINEAWSVFEKLKEARNE
jgi:hypothetical protein